MLALLVIPFLPVRPIGFLQIFSWLKHIGSLSIYNPSSFEQTTTQLNQFYSTNLVNDFSISITRKTPTFIGFLFLTIWLIGILFMLILFIKSNIHLHHLKQSALPLQNEKIYKLYAKCIQEINLKKTIPIYSTVFLKSPIIVGLLKPCIYVPIHLISDYNATDMRYMLLHELQHYKYKDVLANYAMTLANIIYCINPFVWYALKEMRTDREVACDTSVLRMLHPNDYEQYGNTLIHFAEKISLSPFLFTTGISGTMKQMKRRILNIASYQPPSLGNKLKGIFLYGIIFLLLLGISPALSIYAVRKEHYYFEEANKTISYIDLSAYFKEYNGSFVLYNSENHTWNIYNKDYATMRVAPNSTYKIYSALFGLESGIISPKHSQIIWDKKIYPFEVWNSNQDLNSAMKNSVNWYFQSIDKQLGYSAIKKYIGKIEYGNQNISSNLPSYWLESSLKISPIEQINLLRKLYYNEFSFDSEHIQAVKNAIYLSSSFEGSIYGKTGTGCINNQSINGWFIGYIEKSVDTYFFATNILDKSNATGTIASEITLSILSDLQIWN